MTFPTDWDVDKYRVEHECEDHWELRRSFLETHKDKFPEERLVCLAQVFYNVEFMGCRYPEKTMRLVAQLSDGVADEHREKMKSKLQRTFVQASDAASTKVKGRSGNVGTAPTAYNKGPIKFLKSSDPTESTESTEKNDHSTTNTNNLNKSNEDIQIVYEENAPDVNTEKSTESSVNKKKKNRKKKKKAVNGTMAAADPPIIEIVEENDTEPILEENPEDTNAQQAPKGKKKKSRGKKKKKNVEDATAAPESAPGRFVVADQSRFNNPRSQKRKDMNNDTAPQQSKRMKTSNPLSDFVIMEYSQGINPYGILSRSAECARKTLTQHVEQTSTGPKMTLALDGHTLATASGKNLDEAKALCANTALQKLRQSCYTVTLKDRFAGSTVEKDADPKPQETPHHLTDDSKANRMMKLMGWGGGGLGKDQQGRQEPVEVVQRIRRVGLGGSAGVQGPEFRNFILDVLKKYSTSDASHDLVFASDYSKEERAQIHVLAKRFHLKSASYGKDQNRRLVLSIKKTPQQILSDVLKAGGSTDKYEVTPPGSR